MNIKGIWKEGTIFMAAFEIYATFRGLVAPIRNALIVSFEAIGNRCNSTSLCTAYCRNSQNTPSILCQIYLNLNIFAIGLGIPIINVRTFQF